MKNKSESTEDNIIISARKRSLDPNQEHLREQKAIWNASTTDLINKLIAFKRGLNGRGDPRAGLPPSTIKDPLPSEVGSYLHQIAQDYLSLVEGAERIIGEQESYSNNRQKSQLSAADDGLISQASWWGSRWWHTLGIPQDDRKHIRDMLRTLEAFKDQLLDVENYLSSSDPNSIPEVVHIASSFGIGSFKNLIENFNSLGKIYGKVALPKPKKDDTKEEVQKKTEEEEQISSLPITAPEVKEPENLPTLPDLQISDNLQTKAANGLLAIYNDRLNIQSVLKHLLESNNVSDNDKLEIKSLRFNITKNNKFSEYIKKIKKGELFEGSDNKDIELILHSYFDLLKIAASVYGFQAQSFSEYADKVQTLPNVTAHNPVSRWIKKKWLDLKSDFLRKDTALDMRKNKCITHVSDTIREINSLMKVLESKSTVDDIFKGLKTFSIELARVLGDIVALAEYHNSQFRHEYRVKKQTKNVIHHLILEREINKLRRAITGVLQLSSKILEYRPTFWNT